MSIWEKTEKLALECRDGAPIAGVEAVRSFRLKFVLAEGPGGISISPLRSPCTLISPFKRLFSEFLEGNSCQRDRLVFGFEWSGASVRWFGLRIRRAYLPPALRTHEDPDDRSLSSGSGWYAVDFVCGDRRELCCAPAPTRPAGLCRLCRFQLPGRPCPRTLSA